MAMIDYGAIAFKNGKLVSTDMFTPMKDTCGFTDENELLQGCEEKFDGNYFVILGDKDFVIGFYKCMLKCWYKYNSKTYTKEEWFNSSSYIGFRKWESHWLEPTESGIVVKPHNGYYVAKFSYNGDEYKVYFGHGVDLDWYKKTHLVNYYRTCPKFLWRRFWYRVKDLFVK